MLRQEGGEFRLKVELSVVFGLPPIVCPKVALKFRLDQSTPFLGREDTVKKREAICMSHVGVEFYRKFAKYRRTIRPALRDLPPLSL
jgi:hypothetical protein